MDHFSPREDVLGHGERDHTTDIESTKPVAPQTEFEVEFGSGWYHDTAIVEAEQSRPRMQQASR